MSSDIQLRQTNPDETEKMAQYESPNGEAVCGSYIARSVAERLGEFAQAALSADPEDGARIERTAISGNGSGNYAVFESPGGSVTGLYIHNDVWADVLGVDVERDEDDNVTNAPEALGLTLSASDEETFEEAVEEEESVDEEEVDALLGDDTEDSDDTEEVEISDEELDLVDA